MSYEPATVASAQLRSLWSKIQLRSSVRKRSCSSSRDWLLVEGYHGKPMGNPWETGATILIPKSWDASELFPLQTCVDVSDHVYLRGNWGPCVPMMPRCPHCHPKMCSQRLRLFQPLLQSHATFTKKRHGVAPSNLISRWLWQCGLSITGPKFVEVVSKNVDETGLGGAPRRIEFLELIQNAR